MGSTAWEVQHGKYQMGSSGWEQQGNQGHSHAVSRPSDNSKIRNTNWRFVVPSTDRVLTSDYGLRKQRRRGVSIRLRHQIHMHE